MLCQFVNLKNNKIPVHGRAVGFTTVYQGWEKNPRLSMKAMGSRIIQQPASMSQHLSVEQNKVFAIFSADRLLHRSL